MTQLPTLPTRRIRWCGRRKDAVEHAAGDLRVPGSPLHGQRQSQAVDEEGVIVGWANESSARHNQCGST
jgi:hypothetical protein